MRTLLVAALVFATSCANTDELEKKVADLSTELADTRRTVDDLAEEVENANYLQRKIEELEKELARTRDMLATRPTPPTPPTRPSRPEPDRSKTYAVPIGNAPSLGPVDAKVTMVVAHEYACPYCERARPTLEALRKRYRNDLRIVFKQLVVHPRNATASALAICAADKQRKYVQMDKLLWDEGFNRRQLDLSDTTNGSKCWDTADGCPIVVGFAKQLGLDVTRFKADMRACQQELQQGMRELQTFGVAATPSFFINGRFMSGAMPIDNFAALIDEELAKANARIAQGTSKRRYYQQWVLDDGLKSLTPP